MVLNSYILCLDLHCPAYYFHSVLTPHREELSGPLFSAGNSEAEACFKDSFLPSMCSSCGPEGPLTLSLEVTGSLQSPDCPPWPPPLHLFVIGTFIFVRNNRCNQHINSPLDINHKIFPQENLMLLKRKDGKRRQVLTEVGY